MANRLALLLLLLVPNLARAELVGLEFHRREDFAGGLAFGEVGAYEKLVGVARFAVDPAHARNKLVADIELAPRNADGKVEFRADVFILAPKDRAKGNGAILYDVNNRGNKLALSTFNSAVGSNDPATEDHAGNDFLLRRGFTLVWSGWSCEPFPGGGRLLLQAPIVEGGVKGLVSFETSVNTPAESAPLAWRDNLGSYHPVENAEPSCLLTIRQRHDDEPQRIPHAQFSLERVPIPEVTHGVPGTLGQVRLKVKGGLRPGFLYRLECPCEKPPVIGLGFCGVRDLVSFLRHSPSETNPLRVGDKPADTRAIAFGVSQSGRFLRHMLYEGFTVDEAGRRVFDGVMSHVAGGGLGQFNERWGQPTRSNGQHEEHAYPCDRFPFTYGTSEPLTPGAKPDGILKRLADENEKLIPKVMHTQSSAEYFHRAGSLVHTNVTGTADAEIPARVRIYAFEGTQHGAGSGQPTTSPGHGENLPNPADYRPILRALLEAMDAWTQDKAEPPTSVYPRIKHRQLVDRQGYVEAFPATAGLLLPREIHTPGTGPDRPKTLVPKPNQDGHDVGCVPLPDHAVPLATYTGWNLRRREAGAEGELLSLTGSYIPFAKTKAERLAAGDSRESLEERYPSFERYRFDHARAAAELVRAGFMLQFDAAKIANDREKWKERFPAEKPK